MQRRRPRLCTGISVDQHGEPGTRGVPFSGLLPALLLFCAPIMAEAPSFDWSAQSGETEIIRLDSLGREGFESIMRKRKSGKETVFDFEKIAVPAGAGKRANVLMKQGPGEDGTVSRRILDEVEGLDTLWSVEQYSQGPARNLMSRFTIEGGEEGDIRLYGVANTPGWPVFGVSKVGSCESYPEAWVRMPISGSAGQPGPEELKVEGRLEVCLDQRGVFKSGHTGYDSLEFKRYHIRFSTGRKTLRRLNTSGQLGDSEAPAEVRASVAEIEKDRYMYFNDELGPFLAVIRSKPRDGARWIIEFSRVK